MVVVIAAIGRLGQRLRPTPDPPAGDLERPCSAEVQRR